MSQYVRDRLAALGAKPKKTRDEIRRERAKNAGWIWLRKAIQVWLWQDRQSHGARQHNRLTPAQKKLRRYISNQLYYQKNREKLTLQMRENRRFCEETRNRWESARRAKRAANAKNNKAVQ